MEALTGQRRLSAFICLFVCFFSQYFADNSLHTCNIVVHLNNFFFWLHFALVSPYLCVSVIAQFSSCKAAHPVRDRYITVLKKLLHPLNFE